MRAFSLGLLLAFVGYQPGFAAERVVRFYNPHSEPVAAVEVCVGEAISGCAPSVVYAACPGRGLCAVRVDLPAGGATLRARVSESGAPLVWGAWSAPLAYSIPSAAECLASDACALDRDGDGRVTSADFARFLAVFGS